MGKGSRREREYVELCKRAGMATYRPATVQYGENDPFGLFDVFALSPSHSRVHAVQVKSNRASGINGWTRHTELFRRLGFRTFYAVPYDDDNDTIQAWRLVECQSHPAISGEKVDRVDERKDDDVGPFVDTEYNTGHRVVEWLESLQNTGETAP